MSGLGEDNDISGKVKTEGKLKAALSQCNTNLGPSGQWRGRRKVRPVDMSYK